MPFSVWLTKDGKFGKIKETLAWKGVCMMFCKNCGKELTDGNTYCDNCGMAAGQGCNYCDQCGASHLPGAAVCTTCGKSLNPIAQNGVVYSTASQEKPAESSALSIVSLVAGIIGLVCCCGTAMLPNVVAIVCAAIALAKKNAGKGMAIAGLVLGIVGTLIGLLFWVVYNFALIEAFNTGMADEFFDGSFYYNFYAILAR